MYTSPEKQESSASMLFTGINEYKGDERRITGKQN